MSCIFLVTVMCFINKINFFQMYENRQPESWNAQFEEASKQILPYAIETIQSQEDVMECD